MTIITSGPTSVAVTTHLRIGGLDYASSTRLREVLSSCGSGLTLICWSISVAPTAITT